MRFDKFTIKSQELIAEAQSLAAKLNHQQIEPEHLLSVMLNAKQGITTSLLRKLGVSPGGIDREIVALLDRFPKVTGSSGGDAYLSARSKNLLNTAFSEASKMKDQYVSVEHILLAIAEEKQGH
ncbi:MAG: type VI secretion system ATPase TssH, partial [Deltaproteobacteria bacterium]